jgi:hypothetical protein
MLLLVCQKEIHTEKVLTRRDEVIQNTIYYHVLVTRHGVWIGNWIY